MSGLAEEQFFYGKGAGSFPTASAVLSDISALRYDYKYEYKKLNRDNTPVLTDEYYLRIYASFDGLFNVPHHRFERIEEWASNEKRCSVTGIISCTQLAESNWWKQKGVSLILLPDAFADKLPEKKREEEEVLFV